MSKRRRAEDTFDRPPSKKSNVFQDLDLDYSDSDSNSDSQEQIIDNTLLAQDDTLAKLTAEDMREQRARLRAQKNREKLDISDSISGDDDFINIGEEDPDEDLVRQELQSGAVPLEPFNMDNELRKDEIDIEGHWKNRYERRSSASVSEEDEYWLTEYDEKVKLNEKYADIKQAENMFDKSDEDDSVDIIDALEIIVDTLKAGETVQRALKRLKEGNESQNITFGKMTDLTNAVFNGGEYDIYSYKKEDIVDRLMELKKEKGENTDGEVDTSTTQASNNQTNYNDYYQQYYQQIQSNSMSAVNNDAPLY